MRPLLAQGKHIHQPRLQRPQRHRGLLLEGQRHRQGGEHERKRRQSLAQQREIAAASKHPGQQGIYRGKTQRRTGRPMAALGQHMVLQHKCRHGRAEQQRAVYRANGHAVAHQAVDQFVQPSVIRHGCLIGLIAPVQRVEAGQERIEQPMENQERLGAGEILARVFRSAPHHGDKQAADKADKVQAAPGFEAGNCRHAGVEQRQISEQHHMAAAAVAHQNRCGQTADKRHLRHDFRILPHRQRRHRTHQPHHQHKSRARRQKRMQLHRRQRGQIHHRHAKALQNQAVFAAAALQKPTRHGSRQTRAHHAQIAHFNRHMNPLRSKAQQEHQPQKQHHHAGFQQQVAVHQPIDQRGKRTFRLPLGRAGNAAPPVGLIGR